MQTRGEQMLALRRARMAAAPPILRGGFRPFFLGGAVWAVVALVLWLCSLSGQITLPTAFDALAWHRHEMLFGFVGAIIAGFLLTAIPNWTGRLPIAGIPLASLFGLWLAGRLAVLFSDALGPTVAAVIDVGFYLLLAAVAGREVIEANNRNVPVVGVVLLLGIANGLDHLAAGGIFVDPALPWQLAVALVTLLISLIGGRIIPSFTRNWLTKRDVTHGLPGQPSRFDLMTIGLADALLFCGKVYGSSEAVEQTRRWLGIIKREAYRASAQLAAEKGPFPLYDALMLETPNLKCLDDETRALIAEHGLRNGCLTSIAPTGTTSLLAGNVSSGIEPAFAYSYERRILQSDGNARFEPVEDYAMQVWRQLRGEEPPPERLFVSAQTLKPSDHLAMQAAAQALVDSSISKTVNCPEDISFDAFADIYVEGYHLGCKGLMTYRPNAVTGSVLKLSATEEQSGGRCRKSNWPHAPRRCMARPTSLNGPKARMRST